MKKSSIVATVLFVGAAGVITAALLTAGKGSSTRNRMTRKGKLYKDYLMDKFYDFSDSVSSRYEDLEDKTKRLGQTANAKANEIMAELNQK